MGVQPTHSFCSAARLRPTSCWWLDRSLGAHGPGQVTLSRPDGAKDQGLILFVYAYHGKGGYQTEIELEPISQSKFMSSDSVQATVPGISPDQQLLLLPCLQNEGATGPLELAVSGCAGGLPPGLAQLG